MGKTEKPTEKVLTGIEAAAQDYEKEPVPELRQRNWFNVGIVWVGVAVCLPAFMVGGLVGFMLNLTDALIAILVGGFITATIAAICSIVGTRIKLTAPMICRFAFGDRGVYAVALVLALGCYGWFAVQLGLFGETYIASMELLTGVAPGAAGLWLALIIGGILMTATAVFGFRALRWLSMIVVLPMVVLMAISVFQVLGYHPWSELVARAPVNPAPMAVVISMVAGAFMVGAVITPDVSRFSKGVTHSIVGVYLGFFVFFALMMYMGSILAHAVGDWDIIRIMIGLGWGIIAMVILVFAQWTTNDSNLWGATLSLAVVFRRSRRWLLTVAAGVLGIILAVWGIYGEMVHWLMLLGVLIPPIGGIYIADYFILNKGFYKFDNLPKVAKARWLMLAAWAAASFFAYGTTAPPHGFGWFTFTTIPAIDSFVIAFALALILGGVYIKVKGRWPEVTPA